MNIALPFVQCSVEELKALLDGGTLTIYSVARPITADRPVERSGTLATFTFASPAFGAPSDGMKTPPLPQIPSQQAVWVHLALHAPARRMELSSPIFPQARATGRSNSAKFPSRKARP